MKDRLTKLFTTFLAVVLLVGMSPAAATTAYAASWSGVSGSVSSFSFGSWLSGLFGGSKNDSESNSNQNQTEQNDVTTTDGNTSGASSSDETGTANDIQLTKKAVANGTKDGKPAFNIQLGVQGKEVKKGAPVDFTLVVDLSSSMTTQHPNVSEKTLKMKKSAH